MNQQTSYALVMMLVLGGTGIARQVQAQKVPPPATEPYAIAAQADRHLQEGVLDSWYPRCIDEENGGFHQNFAADWSRQQDSNKFLVYQARMTWVAAAVARYAPDLRGEYTEYAMHGLRFLDEKMRDEKHGGLHWVLGPDGEVSDQLGTEKHAYGTSFGIYAGAEVYALTRDERALELAKDAFLWLDEHCHDEENGGYIEGATRDGVPLTDISSGGRDRLYTPLGYKSMNAHIHLLESFTALYRVWPDERLRERLEELHRIVRDRIAVEPGCLGFYFTPDWRSVPMHDSFGHDVETAYLLVESAEALGKHDDEETWRVARSIVDHALEWGMDKGNGALCEKGEAFRRPFDRTKIWWTQSEWLNALLLMHEKYGSETDRYWKAFVRQWQFLWTHQMDHARGGWYHKVSPEGEPDRDGRKGSQWKAAYHNARALMNVVKRLKTLEGEHRK